MFQYPLYSATLAEFNMHQIGYYLNEGKNWSMDMEELERSLAEAKQVGTAFNLNFNPTHLI